MARLAVEGFLAGRHRSICRGYGGEFLQYRGYVPGDDTKYIDWKLFARQERLCTKVFQEETDMKCAMILDASASMNYRGSKATVTKFFYASAITACLAYICRKQGDPAALFATSGEGIAHAFSHDNAILSTLANLVPSGEANLEQTVNQAVNYLNGRGMMIVLSDLHGQEESLEKLLKQLRFNHLDVIIFHVLDDDELELPFTESLRFIDSESQREISALPSIIRTEYQEQMQAFLKQLNEAGLNSQTDLTLLRTSDDLGVALEAYCQRRELHIHA